MLHTSHKCPLFQLFCYSFYELLPNCSRISLQARGKPSLTSTVQYSLPAPSSSLSPPAKVVSRRAHTYSVFAGRTPSSCTWVSFSLLLLGHFKSYTDLKKLKTNLKQPYEENYSKLKKNYSKLLKKTKTLILYKNREHETNL